MADSKKNRTEGERQNPSPNRAANAEGPVDEKSLGTVPTTAGDTSLNPESLLNPPGNVAKQEVPAEFGRYRILRMLGAGAMGTVYLAEDTLLHRQVAIKIPQLGDQRDASRLERFFREARLAATLSHPNLCPIHDIGEHGGTHFISMAFVSGKSLAELLKSGKPISERSAASVVRKLALALHEAHQRGVIHRDLKPANIMIDQRGEPIVMDFGLARQSRGTDQAQITQSGAILGTPAYMSPEQVQGASSAVGAPADIYALGVIFYQLLCRRLPYEGSVVSVLAQIATQAPAAPSTYRAGVNHELEAICLKALARDPADRYGSMADLAAALAEYLKRSKEVPATPHAAKGAPSSAAPAGEFPFVPLEPATSEWEIVTPPAVRPPARRNTRAAEWLAKVVSNRVWIAAGLGVLMVALVGLWFGTGPRDETRKQSKRRKSSGAAVTSAVESSTPDDESEDTAEDDPPAVTSGVASRADRELAPVELPSRSVPEPIHEPAEPKKASADEPADTLQNTDGFVSLFNGKDLAGWMSKPGHEGNNNWAVRNGNLAASGATMSHLFSTRDDFRDFHLRVEVRMKAGGNGGVYCRSPFGFKFPEAGPRFPGGYEAQIADDVSRGNVKTGSLYAQVGSKILPVISVERSPVRAGEWFTMDVIARGNHITIAVNGKKTADYTDTSATAGTRGHIVLQQHDGETEIEFQKVLIKEFGPDETKLAGDLPTDSPAEAAKKPPAAKGGPEFGLNAEFFANTGFGGTPVTRVDSTINFNWDVGSPAPTIPRDYFSGRWTGWLKVPLDGTYQFRVVANDGVRMWLDDQMVPLIDRWVARPVEMMVSKELKAEPAQFKMEVFEQGATAWLVLFWKPPRATRFTPIPPEYFFKTKEAAGARLQPTIHPTQGLRADVYSNAESKTLVGTYYGAGLEALWENESPFPNVKADDFSVILQGYLAPPVTGIYKFRGAGDDRIFFQIDGKMIVQHQEGSEPGEGTLHLDAKKQYAVQLRTLDRRGGAGFFVHWVLPDTNEELSIPTEYLSSQPHRRAKSPTKRQK